MSLLIFVDLDGTISDWRWREKIAGKEPSREDLVVYQRWLDHLQSENSLLADNVVKPLQHLLRTLGRESSVAIVYLTGRAEKYRNVTQKWLGLHGFPLGPLHMRSNNDWRSPVVYKEGVMRTIAPKYNNHVLVLDDDGAGDCSEMYTRNGWTHLKVIL